MKKRKTVRKNRKSGLGNRIWKILKNLKVAIPLFTLVVQAIFYFLVVYPYNLNVERHHERIEDLEKIKTELQKNQTELQEQLFKILHYEPTIDV